MRSGDVEQSWHRRRDQRHLSKMIDGQVRVAANSMRRHLCSECQPEASRGQKMASSTSMPGCSATWGKSRFKLAGTC